MTFDEFAKLHGLALLAQFEGCHKDEGWEHLRFWCTLYFAQDAGSDHDPVLAVAKIGDRQKYEFRYRMGMANAKPSSLPRASSRDAIKYVPKEPPKVAEVLQSLHVDCGVTTAASFEDWCSDFGYDTDSRKAFALWEACRRTVTDVLYMLGPKRFAEFLECTEEP